MNIETFMITLFKKEIYCNIDINKIMTYLLMADPCIVYILATCLIDQ